jgi:hypothetical protein
MVAFAKMSLTQVFVAGENKMREPCESACFRYCAAPSALEVTTPIPNAIMARLRSHAGADTPPQPADGSAA